MKIRFKTILTAGLLTVTAPSFGQCLSKVDEMTNDKIISNELVKIGKRSTEERSPLYFFKMSVDKINQIPFFTFYAERGSASSVQENDIIYIKTQDSVLKVIINKYQITSVKNGEAFTQGTSNIVHYHMISVPTDEATLLFLQNNPPVKIRVDYYDYEINKPQLLTGQINCILKM